MLDTGTTLRNQSLKVLGIWVEEEVELYIE